MRQRIDGVEQLFQRPHWSRDVRETPTTLRMFWAFRNDPGFAFTEEELVVLRRAAAGEPVFVPYLDAHKATKLLEVARRAD